MIKKLLIAIVLIVLLMKLFSNNEIEYGAGVVAPNIPLQTTHDLPDSFPYKDFSVKPLANFELEARVLGKENYHLGTESELVPIDIAFGWARMSDSEVLKDINISQRGRFYYWRVEHFPIPRKDIEHSSANMHLIPSNPSILKAIEDVKTGQIVKLTGYLVSVNKPDGWKWQSSLSRKDTGGGACELIWVDKFEFYSPAP